MKKFTTTFFLLMAIVLLLPTEARAWSDVYLFSTINNHWSSSEKTDKDKFTKTDDYGNAYYKDIDATNITGDISFCLYVPDDDGFEIFPYKNDDVITSEYEAHDGWKNGSYKEQRNENAWKIMHSSDGYTKYRISFRYDTNSKKFYVNVVGTEKATTSTATLTYGSTSISGTKSGNDYQFTVPYGAFNNTTSVSFQLKTEEGDVTKWYNPSSTVVAGENSATESNTGADWTYTRSTVPNRGSLVVTLNPNDKKVTLTDNTSTSSTPTPTPVTGKNLYLVGNFMMTDGTEINDNCRYFKLKDNGDNTYSIDIPATLNVNFQLLMVDNETSTKYGPNGSGYGVHKTHPAKGGSISGNLVQTTSTSSNYWSLTDRTTSESNRRSQDGLYTVTITIDDATSEPASWSITHDNLTRVAYFISDMPGASAQPSYNTRKNEIDDFNHVHYGSVYLEAGAKCFVISNLCRDEEGQTLKAKSQFYLQGNKSGESPEKSRDQDTKVYPIVDSGTDTKALGFVFNESQSETLTLEYDPSKGWGEGTTYRYDQVSGEVKKSSSAVGVELPSIHNLKISGPGVDNDNWDLDEAVAMTYNASENCWEATIETTAPAGNKFRFVANDDWGINWGEDDLAARIPYDDDTKTGSPATVKEPNDVKLDRGSYNSHDDVSEDIPDLLFNRDAGKWTVKFYIETEQNPGEMGFTYKFKYTINGYKSVLRTYCMPENRKPTDENIKIYGAYAFDDESGKVKLYEMNYIPANEGVILIGTGVDDVTAEEYTPAEGETKYKNISDDDYNNYLVGVLQNTKVNASEFDGNGKRTGRNFFFNYLSDTGYYEEGATDYLGFFRIKSGSTCRAHYAYLHLPTTVLTWNGQILDDVLEDGTATLSKGFKLSFGVADEDWGSTTAITEVNREAQVDDCYYNLQGIRVSNPSNGIYIHNGKKVIIK